MYVIQSAKRLNSTTAELTLSKGSTNLIAELHAYRYKWRAYIELRIDGEMFIKIESHIKTGAELKALLTKFENLKLRKGIYNKDTVIHHLCKAIS